MLKNVKGHQNHILADKMFLILCYTEVKGQQATSIVMLAGEILWYSVKLKLNVVQYNLGLLSIHHQIKLLLKYQRYGCISYQVCIKDVKD